MKHFDRITAAFMLLMILLFAGGNLILSRTADIQADRAYRVEVNRAAEKIKEGGTNALDFSEYIYLTNVERYHGNDEKFFAGSDSDYCIRMVGDMIYRLDYDTKKGEDYDRLRLFLNGVMLVLTAFILGAAVYIRQRILKPFEILSGVPGELAKGNLTVPIKANKNRYFGKFVWGLDLLRENVEDQKRRELKLQREKKTLLLSISHDIKTPLAAVKLYANALSKGLYTDAKKQKETAEQINAKADEIEGFISQIVKASNEDFLDLTVCEGEFYLSALIGQLMEYYTEKLKWMKTEFQVGQYSDCILRGDLERSVEVVQNMMENAVKYGDGHYIAIEVEKEEESVLVTVKNGGCMLGDSELSHIFESFWRGSNAEGADGSGLGLFICRQLMHKMGGEIFARMDAGEIEVTAVFEKI